MHSSLDKHLYEINYKYDLLGIHDLFGTELAMIFSFHVGLTDSVMQPWREKRLEMAFPMLPMLKIRTL
jgi:hypothetical protein